MIRIQYACDTYSNYMYCMGIIPVIPRVCIYEHIAVQHCTVLLLIEYLSFLSVPQIVHTSLQDMLPKTIPHNDPELAKPDDEDVEKVTEKTRQALELLVQKKVAAAQPVRAAEKLAPAQYIRYTPSQQGPAFNSGAKQRIIRMVEAQKDPMDPPKFKTNTKIPRGPPSPPAPVLHSPPRKVTNIITSVLIDYSIGDS